MHLILFVYITLLTYISSTYGHAVNKPLILTPLIKENKIREARAAAEVKYSAFKDIKSYAGFFTVDEAYNSNLFFWFFPAKINYANAPVVVWLEGGPGATSIFGLFTESGPFYLNTKNKLKFREHPWTDSHSVIYIDNPVGVGYSFTNDGGYAQNQTIIAEQLYKATVQFFQLFPELQKNDFYPTGESYGSKYAAGLSYAIYKNNPSASLKINLQGFAIGDGWNDPEGLLNYSEYLYQIGLIDANQKKDLRNRELEVINFIQNKQWVEATTAYATFFDNPQTSWFANATGYAYTFNYLIVNDTSLKFERMHSYMNGTDVRAAIHVGNIPFNAFSPQVSEILYADIMQPITPWVSELLNHYRGLIYNGQLDVIVPYPLSLNFVNALRFNGSDEYKTAIRHKWYVRKQLAGYAKQAGRLTEVMVRNAGHLVPEDQPVWGLDMISRFTRNQPFY